MRVYSRRAFFIALSTFVLFGFIGTVVLIGCKLKLQNKIISRNALSSLKSSDIEAETYEKTSALLDTSERYRYRISSSASLSDLVIDKEELLSTSSSSNWQAGYDQVITDIYDNTWNFYGWWKTQPWNGGSPKLPMKNYTAEMKLYTETVHTGDDTVKGRIFITLFNNLDLQFQLNVKEAGRNCTGQEKKIENGCIVAIHKGTSCGTPSLIGPQFYDSTKFGWTNSNPFKMAKYTSDSLGLSSSIVSLYNGGNGYGVDGNENHAIVLYNSEGEKVLCGIMVSEHDATTFTPTQSTVTPVAAPFFPPQSSISKDTTPKLKPTVTPTVLLTTWQPSTLEHIIAPPTLKPVVDIGQLMITKPISTSTPVAFPLEIISEQPTVHTIIPSAIIKTQPVAIRASPDIVKAKPMVTAEPTVLNKVYPTVLSASPQVLVKAQPSVGSENSVPSAQQFVPDPTQNQMIFPNSTLPPSPFSANDLQPILPPIPPSAINFPFSNLLSILLPTVSPSFYFSTSPSPSLSPAPAIHPSKRPSKQMSMHPSNSPSRKPSKKLSVTPLEKSPTALSLIAPVSLSMPSGQPVVGIAAPTNLVPTAAKPYSESLILIPTKTLQTSAQPGPSIMLGKIILPSKKPSRKPVIKSPSKRSDTPLISVSRPTLAPNILFSLSPKNLELTPTKTGPILTIDTQAPSSGLHAPIIVSPLFSPSLSQNLTRPSQSPPSLVAKGTKKVIMNNYYYYYY